MSKNFNCTSDVQNISQNTRKNQLNKITSGKLSNDEINKLIDTSFNNCNCLARVGFHVFVFQLNFFPQLGGSELDLCAVSDFDIVKDFMGKSKYPLPGWHVWLYFSVLFHSGTSVPVKRREWSGYTHETYCHAMASLD